MKIDEDILESEEKRRVTCTDGQILTGYIFEVFEGEEALDGKQSIGLETAGGQSIEIPMAEIETIEPSSESSQL